ncbi:cytochrome oxidase c assembly-domain-containing protein [Coniochaeta sp. 2T2.1]|nr:cytochrome oxidase c assembly-domain-containing protein [Coniochaeta sp. 2T2.1]
MAISTTGPRSVSDATRFTSTTPHAESKTSSPSASSSTSQPSASVAGGRFSRTGTAAAASASRLAPTGGRGPSAPSPSPLLAGETPEQRVARLRAAHEAAKKAQSSKLDVIISRSRRFFDTAHKATVLGLIGLTAVAGLLTIYTAADMMMYNKKRKAEFLEAQRKMAADSLEAARLAYMTNKATPEQIALVEEALERETGNEGSIFSKMPSLIGAPKTLSNGEEGEGKAEGGASGAAAAAWQEAQEQMKKVTEEKPKRAGGIRSWFSSTLAKSEADEDVTKRFGWEGLSEEDDGAGVRDSDLVRAIEEKQAEIKAKAARALQRERENERKGGPLDRVGVDAAKSAGLSKSWWPW